MSQDKGQNGHFQWGLFRYSVISQLLVCPPPEGQLQQALEQLAQKAWIHPLSGEPVHFAFSTIERWYYQARDAPNPVDTLRRAVREDAGQHRVLTAKLAQVLERQYRLHRRWSYQLHADNLAARIERDFADSESVPSYQTVRRFMREKGWYPVKGKGQRKIEEELDKREVRSFEAAHVHALWHLDFHQASCRVVDADGRWFTPVALAILDDRCRLCCHVQWFDTESAATLFHGLMQAFAKRGLPRALLTDNGGAMMAAETTQGLAAWSIAHKTTLPYSPYQNGKQERFWGTLEGRLMAMLEKVNPLRLDLLNTASLAWVEQEYHQTPHDEIGMTPFECLLAGPRVNRPAPDTDALRRSFTVRQTRRLRRGDGTISVEGIRFEIPSRLRHLSEVMVRYRRWDLSQAWVVDAATDQVLARILPWDKERNADGRRRQVESPCVRDETDTEDALPPLLDKYLREFAATGLPAPYIPFPTPSATTSMPSTEEGLDD